MLLPSSTLKDSFFLRWPILFLILLGLGVMLRREWRLQPDGHLHVYFLDVGQGDSAFLISPSGKQIVIDGGPDLSTLEEVGKKMPFFDRSIDLLVLTHPNTDHMVALPSLLRRYHIRTILVTGIPFKLARYEELLSAIEEAHPDVLFADPAKDLDLGDGLVLDIVWPPTDAALRKWKDINDASIVLRALYADQSILFTGDIEESAEEEILASGADVSSTVLKVAHHGSKTSSSTGFLLEVKPGQAVISVAAKNSYGHPSPSILDRFAGLKIPVRMTSAEGTVSLQF